MIPVKSKYIDFTGKSKIFERYLTDTIWYDGVVFDRDVKGKNYFFMFFTMKLLQLVLQNMQHLCMSTLDWLEWGGGWESNIPLDHPYNENIGKIIFPETRTCLDGLCQEMEDIPLGYYKYMNNGDPEDTKNSNPPTKDGLEGFPEYTSTDIDTDSPLWQKILKYFESEGISVDSSERIEEIVFGSAVFYRVDNHFVNSSVIPSQEQ